MTEHPLGWIGQRDQMDTATGHLAYGVASYYQALRRQGLVARLATDLTLQYQAYLLALGTQQGAEQG